MVTAVPESSTAGASELDAVVVMVPDVGSSMESEVKLRSLR